MDKVSVFTPKHKLDCEQNYAEFIAFAKNDLTLFSDHEFEARQVTQRGWECDKWSWYNKKRKKLTIVFGESLDNYNFIPFKEPFADFAKAFVRYELSLDFKYSTTWASSLVWIHKALEERATQNNRAYVDIMHLDNAIINRIEEEITNAKLAAGVKRNIGLSLKRVLTFIKDKRLKLGLQEWSNPFSRPRETKIKLDEDSRKQELDKCPSDYQMLQVADAFHKAETPRQKYFSSLCVMLMCHPSRSTELNSLTINSLQKCANGRLYLMWHPAKGGDPVRKWVPKLLKDVVQQAFDRLIDISTPARAAAKFAYENPDLFLMHDKCITSSNFPQDKPLRYNQFAKAMGLKTGLDAHGNQVGWTHNTTQWLLDLISRLNNVSDWKKELLKGSAVSEDNQVLTKRTHIPTGLQINFPSYRDLRAEIDKQYKTKQFPNYGDVKLYDCVTLVRENEFHKKFDVKPFSWVVVEHGALSDAIGSDRPSGKTLMGSIFDELGITDEDGTRLKLNTHQFRHWLNTKLKLAGEEDWLIAKWSGRADIEQNKAYDGRTEAQKSRLTKRIGHIANVEGVMTVAEANKYLSPYTAESPPPALLLHDLALPVSFKSLGIHRSGVAQFTGIGFCVHNYAESPCVKNGDCTVCSDHKCLKGLPNSLEELKSLESLYEEQLKDARVKGDEGVFGADRWVTSLGFRLSKLKTIIIMMEDPKKPDGTPVSVPDELDPSPVKRSLNIDEKNVIPTFDLTALALADMEE